VAGGRQLKKGLANKLAVNSAVSDEVSAAQVVSAETLDEVGGVGLTS